MANKRTDGRLSNVVQGPKLLSNLLAMLLGGESGNLASPRVGILLMK